MSVFDEIANELVASELAVDAQYSSGGLLPSPLRGILVRTTEDEQRATSVYARFYVSLAAFPVRPARGDEVTIGEELFTVWEVGIDGGGAWLWLRRRAD